MVGGLHAVVGDQREGARVLSDNNVLGDDIGRRARARVCGHHARTRARLHVAHSHGREGLASDTRRTEHLLRLFDILNHEYSCVRSWKVMCFETAYNNNILILMRL